MKLFLSIGAMKAGTTWLYSHLEKHPELYFTPEKEIHFLDHYFNNSQVLRDENRLRNAKNKLKENHTHLGVYRMLSRWYAMYLEAPDSFKWYERIFSLNNTERYNCDFSNLTCHLSKGKWQELISITNQLKVIYIVRDPLKRYWSHVKFHHEFIGAHQEFGDWSVDKFTEFLNKPFIKSNGTYAVKIQILNEVLDATSFKLLNFENLVSDPTNSLKEIEDFLGISNQIYDPVKLLTPSNASKKIPMPDNFKKACSPLVAQEIKQLKTIGFQIPANWTTD